MRSKILFVLACSIVFMSTPCLSTEKPKKTTTISKPTSATVASKVKVYKPTKPTRFRVTDASRRIVAPKPLTHAQKRHMIRQVAKAAGFKRVAVDNPRVTVRLTADAPRSGQNWMTILDGHNYPAGSNYIPAIHATVSGRSENSFIVLHFGNLKPGKLYLLDLALSSYESNKPRWKLLGAAQGIHVPQNGHIILGFIASGRIEEVAIYKKGSRWGYLYTCELTQVN